MQFLNTRPLGILAVTAALMLAGCGGGSSNSNNAGPFTIDNDISRNDFFDDNDDRYYDIFSTRIERTGTAEIEMSSFDLDSQVFIYLRDSRGDFNLVAEDDDSGDGPDAVVRFSVRRGETFRVIATSARRQEFGDYRLFFSREFGRPSLLRFDGNNRTEPGFDLPAVKAKGEVAKRAAK